MIRILVVEDSPTQAEELRLILESQGFEVETASDGQQGLQLFQAAPFDLVTTDILMPGISGYEFCRRIKADAIKRDVPVILLTTLNNPINIVEGLACGADNFITKPVRAEYLLERIRSVLANKAIRKNSKLTVGIEMLFLGKTITITSDREQILDLLISAFEDLLRKNAELENATLAKSRFLASMSHELRTPLNAIIGFTGTLLMRLPGPLNEEQEEQLKTIESSAAHLLSLINDLLDLAKIESGKVSIKMEPVACQNVLQEVATALRMMAEAKGLRFQVHVPDPDQTVQADRRALTQILLNLTNNAIKFTESGSVELGVGRHRLDDREVTEFRVTDTGIGIRPEDQAKLFQSFEQLSDPLRSPQQGTGLGLHLSQKLAHLLGGQIHCSSQYGMGSTFKLVL